MPFSDYFIKTSVKDHIEGYPKPPKYMMTDRMYTICIAFAIAAMLSSVLLAYIGFSRANARALQNPSAVSQNNNNAAAQNH